jgi:3-isopropylmalate/(R)-2-methylmalate dehydratase small subunit
MKLKGTAHKFGDDVNTDEIIPAKYLVTTDPAELAGHCMEGKVERFSQKIKAGDILVAGKNFGCGSSREHAPLALKGCGVSCVIAKSFARIFFRNCINMALPVLESREAVQGIDQNDVLEIDLARGEIKNITKKQIYKVAPFPKFIHGIIASGGLLESISLKSQ